MGMEGEGETRMEEEEEEEEGEEGQMTWGKIELSYCHRGHGNTGDEHPCHIMDVPHLISYLLNACISTGGRDCELSYDSS